MILYDSKIVIRRNWCNFQIQDNFPLYSSLYLILTIHIFSFHQYPFHLSFKPFYVYIITIMWRVMWLITWSVLFQDNAIIEEVELEGQAPDDCASVKGVELITLPAEGDGMGCIWCHLLESFPPKLTCSKIPHIPTHLHPNLKIAIPFYTKQDIFTKWCICHQHDTV